MTDTFSQAEPATPSTLDDAQARWALISADMEFRDKLLEQVRPANKAAILDALARAGVSTVLIVFDGCGDSGQIESVEARAGDQAIDLPAIPVALADVPWSGTEVTVRDHSLPEALEHLAYGLLEQVAAGWENNDGAYGEFTFDVAARTVTLDYNERMTTSEHTGYEW